VASIPSISREFLHVPVTGATDDMPVDIAVVARDAEPDNGDWHTATWDDGNAKILIGPDTDLPLTDGVYSVWVRVTSTPEIPAMRAGLLRIT
jgi:hypothetical protein